MTLPTPQAHRGVRPHHLRVGLALPQGLSPRGPGGRGRGGRVPAQVKDPGAVHSCVYWDDGGGLARDLGPNPYLCFFRADPDLEFEGLLKRQHTRVKYFQGSLMNAMDLERAKVRRESEKGALKRAIRD